ncbi:hypothetical protein [Lysobacter gummosus]|uniref:hypothetical protein n=1 Tax=Lysobacter gummosus TaxID=262324 RepID=UPI00362F2F5C
MEALNSNLSQPPRPALSRSGLSKKEKGLRRAPFRYWQLLGARIAASSYPHGRSSRRPKRPQPHFE